MADKLHEMIIKTVLGLNNLHAEKSQEFNKLFKATGLPKDIFKGQTIRGVDLSNADLRALDMTDTYLKGCIKTETTMLPDSFNRDNATYSNDAQSFSYHHGNFRYDFNYKKGDFETFGTFKKAIGFLELWSLVHAIRNFMLTYVDRITQRKKLNLTELELLIIKHAGLNRNQFDQNSTLLNFEQKAPRILCPDQVTYILAVFYWIVTSTEFTIDAMHTILSEANRLRKKWPARTYNDNQEFYKYGSIQYKKLWERCRQYISSKIDDPLVDMDIFWYQFLFDRGEYSTSVETYFTRYNFLTNNILDFGEADNHPELRRMASIFMEWLSVNYHEDYRFLLAEFE
jgi:hypothetical protein